jgi:hypothetical protein
VDNEQENEQRVRAFYEATVPGHENRCEVSKRRTLSLIPEGMPIGCGHFEGLEDVLERFLNQLP